MTSVKLTPHNTRLILCVSIFFAIILEVLFVRPNLMRGHFATAEEAIILASAPIAVALYTSLVLLRHETRSRRERFGGRED